MGFRVQARKRLRALRLKKRMLRMMAISASALALLTGATAAWAGGSWSIPSGGGEGNFAAGISFAVSVNFGTDANSALTAAWAEMGIPAGGRLNQTSAQAANATAKQRCVSEYQGRNPGASEADAGCRMVALGAIIVANPAYPGGMWDGSGIGFTNDNWYNGTAAYDGWNDSYVQSYAFRYNDVDYTASSKFADGGNKSMNDLFGDTVGSTVPSLVAIWLSKDQPAEQDYSLSVETQAQRTPNAVDWYNLGENQTGTPPANNLPTLIEGSSNWVRDRIKFTRSGSTLDENVLNRTTLAYKASGGFGGEATHTLRLPADTPGNPNAWQSLANHDTANPGSDGDNKVDTVTHSSNAFTYSAFGHTTGWRPGYYWFNNVTKGTHMKGDGDVVGAEKKTNGDGVTSERWRVLNRHDARLGLESEAGQGLVAQNTWDQGALKDSTVTQSAENTVYAGSSSTLTDRVRVKLLGACGQTVFEGGVENSELDSDCDKKMDTFHFAVTTKLTFPGQKKSNGDPAEVSKSLNYRSYHVSGNQCAPLGQSENADGDVDYIKVGAMEQSVGCATFGFSHSDFGWSVWPSGNFTFTSAITATGCKGAEGLNGAKAVESCGTNRDLVRSSAAGMYAICLRVNEWTSADAASENGYLQPQMRLAVSTSKTRATASDGLITGDNVTVRLVDDEDNAAFNRYLERPTDIISGLTIPVQGSYYWTPSEGTAATKTPANAKLVCQATPRYLKRDATATDPATYDVNWNAGASSVTFNVTRASVGGSCASADTKLLGTGHYTWVWYVPVDRLHELNQDTISIESTVRENTFTFTELDPAKLFDVSAAHDSDTGTTSGKTVTDTRVHPTTIYSDGWQPATEQTQMNTPWTFTLYKHGRIGKADGTWSMLPAKNAKLDLVEIDAGIATSGNVDTIHNASVKTGGQNIRAIELPGVAGHYQFQGLTDLEPEETLVQAHRGKRRQAHACARLRPHRPGRGTPRRMDRESDQHQRHTRRQHPRIHRLRRRHPLRLERQVERDQPAHRHATP